MGNKKSYDRSFKEEAVKLAEETSVSKAAQSLGLPENTLRNWVRNARKRPDNPFIGGGHKYISEQDAKTAALEKENKELKRANEILKNYAVTLKCRSLNVTKQGYYNWVRSLKRSYKYVALLAMIREVLAEDIENKSNYGAKRVFLRLKQPEYGYEGSYSTVYRIMKSNKLLQKKKCRSNSLTKEDYAAQKSENLINQDFTASVPNKKWLSDITEITTAEGKLYIAPVLDCFDGQIVGLAMDDNMKKNFA